MSILIKGMEMPPTGNYFMLVKNKPGIKPNVTVWKQQPTGDLVHFAFGEIVEIQAPHGDLISREQAWQMMLDRGYQKEAAGVILEVPTVIPAEEATE